MSKFIDLTGKRFGRLVVIERDENYISNKGHQYAKFKCYCDCGNIVSVKSRNLIKGHTKSCGCLRYNKTNLIGKIFGQLTVVEKSNNGAWKCKCSCGNYKIVKTGHLNEGSVVSCGCKNKFNLIGQKFGRLKVLNLNILDSKNGRRRWNCECDCGNHHIVGTSDLKNGRVLSCGCYNSEKSSERFSKPDEETSLNAIFRNYKANAEKRNLEFCLQKSDFEKIIKENCFYCGSSPFKIVKLSRKKKNRSNYLYNGIDRIDNSRGYILDNVVSCCETCNRMKMAMKKEDFIYKVEQIYNHSIKKTN